MFLPIGTDAPIEHRPLATLGLIAANGAAFWQTSGGSRDGGWILRFGELVPAEWWTSAFLHFGIAHLVVNMVFLWTFGLIVEGKLGWWRFLLLYLGLCGATGFVTQVLTLTWDGYAIGAGGASGVIYALMAIALVWAPTSNIDVLMVWGIGIWARVIREFEATVFTFALYYIATDFLVGWLLLDFRISTPVLHLIGAAVGFPAGVLLLRSGWVDCEGWDLFSVIRRRLPTQREVDRPASPGATRSLAAEIADELRRERDPQRELRRIRRLLDDGRTELAWHRYRQLRDIEPPAHLDEPALRRLIVSLHERAEWPAVADVLDEYLAEHGECVPRWAIRARLLRAAVLVKQLDRPRAALKTLESIDAGQLSPPQRQFLDSVRRLAERQIEAGVLELHTAAPALATSAR